MAGTKQSTKQRAVTPQRGTIASRYLQAISHQTAAASTTNIAVATPPQVDKNKNANNNSFLSFGTVDCSSMTASTAMLDQSESWTTTGTKSRSGGTITTPSIANTTTPTGTPTRRRRSGAGSQPQTAQNYSHYPPGSQSVMPLTGGSTTPTSSRPTTPTKHLPPPGTSNSAKSIMEIDNDDSSLESAPSPTGSQQERNLQRLLAIEMGNLEVPQQQQQDGRGLLAKNFAGMGCSLPNAAAPTSRPTTPTNSSRGSYSYATPGNSSHSRGRGSSIFPRTSPQTDLSNPYTIKRSTGAASASKSPRSTSDSSSKPRSPSAGWMKQEYHDASATSEAGAPTEVMTNLSSTKDLVLTHRIPRKHSRHQPREASEAGAPTEVMTNRTSDVLIRVREKWNSNSNSTNNNNNNNGSASQSAMATKSEAKASSPPTPEQREKWEQHEKGVQQLQHHIQEQLHHEGERDGKGGIVVDAAQEESEPLYNIPHQMTDTNRRASSRINSYWNSRKNKNQHMPSLVDSQSSSVSSLPDERRPEPNVARQQGSHSAHARLLDSLGPNQQPIHYANNSRLSQHVQKARQQSILSPTASETTASMPSIAAAVVNEPLTNRGEGRLLRSPHNEVIVEEEEVEVGQKEEANEGLGELESGRNTPSGSGRVVALAAQLRRTKWTVRGAQQQQQNQQSALSEKMRKKQVSSPDPIISIAGGPDDFDGYHDEEDEESTLPEYTENHQNGVGDRADEFVVYNERSVQNAAGVFQSRGPPDSPDSEHSQGNGEEKERRRSFSQHSRYSNASADRGKSPIQPLFSLDRVDLESSEPSVHQLRGRSMTPEQFMRAAGTVVVGEERHRRSQSLSKSVERNLSNQGNGNTSSMDVPEYLFVHKQKYDDDEDNSVLDAELVHIMEGKGEYQRSRSGDNPSPHFGKRTETPSSMRARTPSETRRSTSDRARHTASMTRPASANEVSIASSHGRSGVLTTKSVKDKIRAFNMLTPEKWRKSPAVESPSPHSPEQHLAGMHSVSSQSQRAAYRYQTREEEKKEEDFLSGPGRHSIDRDDDSSVKSLRDKLEKRFAKRHASLGLGKDDEETNDDEYSVQSLRDRLEQRIQDALKDPNDDNEDEGSVRSLRERFENPPTKNKGDHFSNLRAMFESKPRHSKSSSRWSSVKLADFNSRPKFTQVDVSNAASLAINQATSDKQTVLEDQYLIDFAQGQQSDAIIGNKATYGVSSGRNESYKHPESTQPDDTGKGLDSPLSARNIWTTQAEIPSKSINQTNGGGYSKNNVFSRFNQWANERELGRKEPHAIHDQLENATEQFHAAERTATYDVSPVSEGGRSPDTEVLIAAVSDDEQKMIPGFHWTTSDKSNVHRTMPERGDVQGASSESDYSEAVTLDASIADVSLLTNPSAIRSKCSKESREADRLSDASSSLFELVAKKSEASSSQPSESAAPLIPGPLHRMSDDYSQDAIEKIDSLPDTNSDTADSREHALEWQNQSFPLQKEPQHDSFQLDPADVSAFSDSAWPDFGDLKDFSHPMDGIARGGEKEKDSWSVDPPQMPSLQTVASPTEKRNQFRRVDPPSTFDPSIDTSSKNEIVHNNRQYADTADWKQTAKSPHRQVKEPAAIRLSELSQLRPAEASTAHSTPVTSAISDYGPSREHISRHRGSDNGLSSTPTREDSIKVPEVPPLPSPFDPNYASIMESRHKMLLSRQRALLHRRAARERNQVSTQPGFFGRTHPERPSHLSHGDPAQLSYSGVVSAPKDKSAMSASIGFGTGGDEPWKAWEAFGSTDPSQRTFEALTRPAGNHVQYGKAAPQQQQQLSGSRSTAPRVKTLVKPSTGSIYSGPTAQPNPSTFYSKIKSTFGLKNEYRDATQSEAVIARITAVRAARLRRYHEKNAANLSYRQRIIDRDAVKDANGFIFDHQDGPFTGEFPGYRYYTHDDDDYGMPPRNPAENPNFDDNSLSSNSNAIDYAANLAID